MNHVPLKKKQTLTRGIAVKQIVENEREFKALDKCY